MSQGSIARYSIERRAVDLGCLETTREGSRESAKRASNAIERASVGRRARGDGRSKSRRTVECVQRYMYIFEDGRICRTCEASVCSKHLWMYGTAATERYHQVQSQSMKQAFCRHRSRMVVAAGSEKTDFAPGVIYSANYGVQTRPAR